MEMLSNTQEHPNVSAEERTSHDLTKRIVKLRWIGMEVEAEQMQLALRRVEPGRTLLADPADRD